MGENGLQVLLLSQRGIFRDALNMIVKDDARVIDNLNFALRALGRPEVPGTRGRITG